MSLLLSSDAAAGAASDVLAFDRYVEPLVEVMCDEQTSTPLTIGVFGAWGTGKSSLLRMLAEGLLDRDRDGFVHVDFNPWVHRNEDDLLIPLLHALHDALSSDRRQRFTQSAKRIFDVGARLSVDILLKRLTADAASLENIGALSKSYMAQRGQVESETRRLKEILQQEADRVAERDARIVVFIDDLDRCQPDQIIEILEMVKLFLDLRHTFIVLAVDQEVIDRGIQVKYSDFKFASGREVEIGAEYLEKMVQLPLQLHALHVDRVRAYLEALRPPPAVVDQLDLLQTVVLPNPRKIKRVANILALTDRILSADDALAGFDRSVVARLVVLQVQATELYAAVVAHPDLLVALDAAYAGQRHDRVEDFVEFGARAQAIFELTQRWYRADSYLTALFADAPFTAVRDQLPFYLGMLGPPRVVA
jgi:hypothetical protein